MSEPYVKMAQRFDADPTTIPSDPIPVITERDRSGMLLPDAEANAAQAPHLQTEFYALTAILVRDTVEFALAEAEHHPPYGLVGGSYDSPGIESFDELNVRMLFTLRRATLPIRVAERDGTNPVVNRLRTMTGVLFAGDNTHRYRSVRNLLGTGINTAVDGLTQSAMAVNRVANEVLPIANQADIAAIARRSGRIANRLAAVNIDHLYASFGAVMTSHGGDTFISKDGVVTHEAMELIKHPTDSLGMFRDHNGELYVDFVQPINSTPSPLDESGQPIGDTPTSLPTLGCPARAKLCDEPTALKKLWDWTVDIAEEAKLFQTKY